MQVHYSTDHLPLFKNAALTIGTFDGVHKGHREVIDAVVAEAKKTGGESVLVSFHPHPRKIVNSDTSLQLINTLDEKIELIEKTGIDHLVISPFTTQFAEQTANEYVENFLVKKFHPHTIIIGYDHHFGKGREGNFDLLKQMEQRFSYKLLEIPKHVIDEIEISSTKIRNALLHSDIETANKLLSYCYFFYGKVVHGDALGRKMGFPTANLVYTNEDKIRLGQGVYAVMVKIDSIPKRGMLSIGTRPTVNDTLERVEVNIFDFDGDLYNKTLKVMVKKFLRPQEKYNSIEAMQQQLLQDKQQTLQVLSGYS
ncbi:MAG: bifunctional riboflavin kinase/FAD synthetase [Chitinophagaceae bacterium]